MSIEVTLIYNRLYLYVVAGLLVLVNPYFDLDANLIRCAPMSNTARTFFIHTSPRMVSPPLFGWIPLKHWPALAGTIMSKALTKKIFFSRLTPNTGGLAVHETK